MYCMCEVKSNWLNAWQVYCWGPNWAQGGVWCSLDERLSRNLQAIGHFWTGTERATALAGVLPRTQGSAVSSVKLFGWAVLKKAASRYRPCSWSVSNGHMTTHLISLFLSHGVNLYIVRCVQCVNAFHLSDLSNSALSQGEDLKPANTDGHLASGPSSDVVKAAKQPSEGFHSQNSSIKSPTSPYLLSGPSNAEQSLEPSSPPKTPSTVSLTESVQSATPCKWSPLRPCGHRIQAVKGLLHEENQTLNKLFKMKGDGSGLHSSAMDWSWSRSQLGCN